MIKRPIAWTLWLLGLVALAVILALAGRYGQAYAVFIVPPWRIELSLFLFGVLFILLVTALVFGIRLAEKIWRLRRALREKRREQKRLRTLRALHQGWADLYAGRFREAEHKGRRAAEADSAEVRSLGWLLAAWAAHEGGRGEYAADYFQRIDDARAAPVREASRARMALAAGRSKEAMEILEPLSGGDGIVKWKMQAAVAEGEWEIVLATLPLLKRSRLVEPDTLQGIRLYAENHILASLPADRDTLLLWWKALAPASRYDPVIAATVARRLTGLAAGDDARRLIEDTVQTLGEEQWDSSLAAVYAECECESTFTQIEKAELWLATHARDPVLLASLGKLCMRQSLWGKAQGYLEAALTLAPSVDAHLTLAKLMEQIGKPEEAARHIRSGAEIAQ